MSAASVLKRLEVAEAAVADAQQRVDECGAHFREALANAGWKRVVGAFSNDTELYASPDGEELLTLPTLRDRIKENNK